MEQWRLLTYQCHTAAYNMALDEAILEAYLQNMVPPTLRLYGFQPEAISVGRTQSLPASTISRASARGLDVVRRPTGGRAVLHSGDLTYSLVASSAAGTLSPSIAAAYAEICRGLQNAFALLGLELSLGSTDTPYRQLHDCFLATTGSDLQFKGKKMVGSAQLRRRNGVLQHGSILLNQEQNVMPEILGVEQSEQPACRHANLYEAAGRTYSIEELQSALIAGFEKAFSIELVPGAPANFEMELTAKLEPEYRVVRDLAATT